MEGFSQESEIMTNSELETFMGNFDLNSVAHDLFATPECIMADRTSDGQRRSLIRPDSYVDSFVENHSNGAGDHLVESTSDIVVPHDVSRVSGNPIYGPTGTMPSTEEFNGPFNFEIQFSNLKRCSWTYSKQLRKVFIDMNKVWLVQFKLCPRTCDDLAGLKVRALLMFSAPDYMSVPVERCTLHWAAYDAKHQAHIMDECLCVNFNHVGHVLTSKSADAYYEYDVHSGRHSVMVPITPVEPAYGVISIAYQFGCKSSCQGGMARRPTTIIFTLENSSGEVIGRRSMALKVCSCPERDKKREELNIVKGKRSMMTPTPAKFKLLTEPDINCDNVLESNYVQEYDRTCNYDVEPTNKKIKIDPQLLRTPLDQDDYQQMRNMQPSRQPLPYHLTTNEHSAPMNSRLSKLSENTKKPPVDCCGNCLLLSDRISKLTDAIMSHQSLMSDRITGLTNAIMSHQSLVSDRISGLTDAITSLVSPNVPE